MSEEKTITGFTKEQVLDALSGQWANLFRFVYERVIRKVRNSYVRVHPLYRLDIASNNFQLGFQNQIEAQDVEI